MRSITTTGLEASDVSIIIGALCGFGVVIKSSRCRAVWRVLRLFLNCSMSSINCGEIKVVFFRRTRIAHGEGGGEVVIDTELNERAL
jgi:hypothetical protein